MDRRLAGLLVVTLGAAVLSFWLGGWQASISDGHSATSMARRLAGSPGRSSLCLPLGPPPSRPVGPLTDRPVGPPRNPPVGPPLCSPTPAEPADTPTVPPTATPTTTNSPTPTITTTATPSSTTTPTPAGTPTPTSAATKTPTSITTPTSTPTATPSATPTLAPRVALHFSIASGGVVGGIPINNEDVVSWDGGSGLSTFFDGSDEDAYRDGGDREDHSS